MADEDDFDLSALPDGELVEQMHDDLYDGMKDAIEEGTSLLLDRGWSAEKVLNEALVDGMAIVGVDFRDGILFVPEVLLAANAMKGGMEILRPILAASDVEPIGKVVIGTVKGDVSARERVERADRERRRARGEGARESGSRGARANARRRRRARRGVISNALERPEREPRQRDDAAPPPE